MRSFLTRRGLFSSPSLQLNEVDDLVKDEQEVLGVIFDKKFTFVQCCFIPRHAMVLLILMLEIKAFIFLSVVMVNGTNFLSKQVAPFNKLPEEKVEQY